MSQKGDEPGQDSDNSDMGGWCHRTTVKGHLLQTRKRVGREPFGEEHVVKGGTSNGKKPGGQVSGVHQPQQR